MEEIIYENRDVESKWRRRNCIAMENVQDGMENEGMATKLVQGNRCSSSKKGR